MHTDGLYDLLLDAATAPRMEALAAEGKATLVDVSNAERRNRLLEALQRLLPELLEDRLDGTEEEDLPNQELALVNGLLRQLRRQDSSPADHWTAPLRTLRSLHRTHTPFEPPELPLSVPWLFASGQGDPSLLSELTREMPSADQVDMVVSFITWSGVRKLLPVLEGLTALGADGTPSRRIRVLTTTYIGATELRAIQELAALPGVEVRISLDGRRTRLHAKAWILHRKSGFGTAFVGSANLSAAALMGGLEWTVRFTQAGQGELFESAKAHFETLWHDPEFQTFDPSNESHVAQLRTALKQESQAGSPGPSRTWFDLQPKAYQQEMLDHLQAERRHGRNRNLLVAATGTGKTVIAAFDYHRICRDLGGRPRLLFVAHRKEILVQARETYRQVLRQSDFGELLADGLEPEAFDHVFATIQSLSSRDLLGRFGHEHWHTVVIDECHHLAAASFDAFARAIRPAVLLGLTATPERADGQSLAPYFDMRPDGSPAAELRLWEALNHQLLAPFEYFGVTDETDFRGVRWQLPGEAADLDRILSGNHIRAGRVLQAFERYASMPHQARVLGFCVSVAHAHFMAEQFQQAGYCALAVTGTTDRDLRESIPGMLARQELTVVFTCDLYNEGVDLPEVDTLLLLRPTQSPVLFQQQIGRGLRLAHGKSSCLVLDFVGRHREEFRFDRLLGTLTGQTRRQLLTEVEAGFPSLPGGCHIQFERVARDRVLEHLRRATTQNWRRLAGELQAYRRLPGKWDPAMAEFLRDQGIDLRDLYRATEPSGWSGLRRAAGMDLGPSGEREPWLGKRFGDLLHADDPDYLQLWARVAEPTCAYSALGALDQKRVQMLAYQIYPDAQDVFGGEAFHARLQAHPTMARELRELASWLDEASELAPCPLPGAPASWPLNLHGTYGLREILTAVGHTTSTRRPLFREGVLALKEEKIELLFVTLDKREGYHAGIAYHDYAISPDRFHWQTQNSAGPHTMVGRRYLESDTNGWRFQLFVRPSKGEAYRALGPVRLASAEGDRPMSLTWVLEAPMPMALFQRYSVLRGR